MHSDKGESILLKRNLGSAAIPIVCGITVITNPFSTTAVLWMFIGIALIVDAVFDLDEPRYSEKLYRGICK